MFSTQEKPEMDDFEEKNNLGSKRKKNSSIISIF